MDERAWYLDNWEEAIKEAIKEAIDIEAKAAQQPTLFTKKIDGQYTRGYQPLKTKDFGKNVEAKKSLPSSSANYINRQLTQPSQIPIWPNKKKFHICRGNNQY